MIIHLIVGLIKTIYKRSYFSEQNTLSKNKIKVELDLSSYATKSDLKNATGVDTSKFSIGFCLVRLKSDVYDLDIDKSKTIPVVLSKLSNLS